MLSWSLPSCPAPLANSSLTRYVEHDGVICFSQINMQVCHAVRVICADSKDYWAEGNLVLWAPVQGQQRFLHLAET